MFDQHVSVIGLSDRDGLGGESHETWVRDQECFELSTRMLADVDGDVDVAGDRDVLPDGLEDIPVGVYLAAVVGSVDRSRLNGHDLVRLLQAESRLSDSFQALMLASVSEVAHCPPGDVDGPVVRSVDEVEYAAVEIAAALTLTRRGSEVLLETALSLSGRLKTVWERFAGGHVGLRKVEEFVNQLGHLDQVTIDVVLDRTLDDAAGLTTGQLRARIQKQVMVVDPEGAASRFDEGVNDRRLVVYPNPDFTGNLSIRSAAPEAIARAVDNVDHIARSLKTDGEPRCLDQLRVDVALDLLAGACHCGETSQRGGVNLTVPLVTLARLADTPGDYGGYGPVIADIARQTALNNVDTPWTFTVVDPDHQVVATGTTARRPRQAQKRRTRAEYQTCVMVGCRIPAFNCDLDHQHEYARGGATHNDNLAPLCRHHHMVRHHVPWKHQRQPNGDHQWTSPLGHTYLKQRGPPD